MPSCVRSGELAVSVTGRAAGEGEGRPAAASTKRGRLFKTVHRRPIDYAWQMRVETGWPMRTVALCVGLLDHVWLLWWLGVEN
jgi:hypothetical protein